MNVTYEQEQVLIGGLLGDSCLFKDKLGKNYRMNFAHSLKQKDYFLYKYKILKDILKSNYRERTYLDKRTNKEYSEIRVQSVCDPFYTDLHSKWYINGKRGLIDYDSINKIDLLGLSIWYQDDGYKSTSGGGYIALYSYTEEQKLAIINIINQKFGLNSHLQGKNLIYFPKREFEFFKEIIKPFIVPCMEYKI